MEPTLPQSIYTKLVQPRNSYFCKILFPVLPNLQFGRREYQHYLLCFKQNPKPTLNSTSFLLLENTSTTGISTSVLNTML